ncbi:MAG: hypothetical protein AB7O98_04660 [Hyphomonadaceae bacterium]
MSKVIVERPRSGRAVAGLSPGRTRAVVDDDGVPVRAVKNQRELKGRERKTKNLNETLNPLRRYLGSNLNRPWNKVYSEISENLKVTSAVQQHVRDHLEDFVAIRTRMKGGKVVAASKWGRGDIPLDDDYRRFYVHPRTGILRENEKRLTWQQSRRRAREAAAAELAARMRVVDASTQLHMFNGDWWEVKLRSIKRRDYRDAAGRWVYSEAPYADVVRAAKLSTLPEHELYGRHGVYASAKRQLSKVEMKRLKLR